MNPLSHHNPAVLAEWMSIVNALPIPAALVTPDGVVIDANRWIDVVSGTDLLVPSADVSETLRIGVKGQRWRVRPVDAKATVLLATGEREDVGDHLLRKFFSSGDALFVVYDQEGRIIQSNAAWESLLGYSKDEIFGIDSWTFLPDDDLETRATVEAELRAHGRSDPTFKMRRADGELRLVQWNLHFDFSVGRCFGIGRDITDENRAAAELQRRASTDPLTGLANRVFLMEQLRKALADNKTPAVLYCDLDRFKVVNDSLGHGAGDALLAKLASRLNSVNAGDGIVVARFGGDEFVVLIPDTNPEGARLIAQSFKRALERPFMVDGRSIHASMSMGIAVPCVDAPCRPLDLLGNADTAVYEAKRRGRGQAILFDEELRAATARRFDVETGLRDALSNGGIETWFQPLVDLSTGAIVGAEALVRWNEGGTIQGPGYFLDIAEEARLLPEIGHEVRSSATAVISELTATNPGFLLSLNVSHGELIAPGFMAQLLSKMSEYSVSPCSMLVEITESTAIKTEHALPILNELRSEGFRTALDDFGTGFSSLAHLRDLPIDVVKIDRSFVALLAEDPVTWSLTRSVVELSHALGLEIVMEGIETLEQEQAVRKLGCNIAQGFLYYRPMPAHDLLTLMSGSESADQLAA